MYYVKSNTGRDIKKTTSKDILRNILQGLIFRFLDYRVLYNTGFLKEIQKYTGCLSNLDFIIHDANK